MIALTLAAAVGGTVLAAIGFTGSYTALVRLGLHHGFGWFAHVFPIGVDAGIGVLLALDLHLIRRQTPWPVLRLLAHLLTVATIVFNASSAAPHDTIGAAMHAVLPVLFVASVEAGRRLVVKAADLEAGRESAGVPLHRWLLAPGPTWRMYRRMRLWGIGSYPQAVAMEQDRTVYRAMLERRYGDWRKAPSDARLPFTMARYGLSVDQALALPAEAEEAERLREEKAEDRKVQAQMRADQRAAEAEVAKLRAKGSVETVRHAVEAETGVAAVESQAAKQTAQDAAVARHRAAVAEAEALESAAAAEANRRAAEANRAAVETQRLAAEAEERVAETARRAAEAQRAAAEAEKAATLAADESERVQAEEAACAAEARQRAAEADQAAAEAEKAASETRARVAESERAAAETEKETEAARAAAAETNKRAVEADRATAQARAEMAQLARRAAEDEARAAEAAERAASARHQAAAVEQAAIEAEDAARLTPTERAARKVARMILATGTTDPKAVKLQDIAEALGVSTTVATQRRKEAAELLAGGYRS